MSSIHTNQAGIYKYQRYYKHPSEGRKRAYFSLSTRDENEAKELKERWDRYYDKLEAGENPSKKRLSDAREEYIKVRERMVEQGQLSSLTLRGDRGALEKFGEIVGDYIISTRDNTELIRDFKNQRLNDVSPATTEKELTKLSGFFTWMKRKGIIDTHPMDTIKLPKNEVEVKAPSKSEWQKIKDEIEKRVNEENFYKALYLITRTGMRIGEVVIMTWEKKYTDRQKYAYLNSSEKTLTIKFKGRKRTIPLYHDNCWEVIQKIEKNGSYVFQSPHKHNDGHIKRDSWSNRTSQFMEEIGFPEYSAHSMRHSFCSELVRKDVSFKKIADMVGHSHSRIVELYSHLDVKDLGDMMQEL